VASVSGNRQENKKGPTTTTTAITKKRFHSELYFFWFTHFHFQKKNQTVNVLNYEEKEDAHI
jgi:hypothetical protein